MAGITPRTRAQSEAMLGMPAVRSTPTLEMARPPVAQSAYRLCGERWNLFLLLIGSHSKWLEVFPTKTTSLKTMELMLRHLSARYGFSHEIVSDNGPGLSLGSSRPFANGKEFVIRWYRLSTKPCSKRSGAAERAPRWGPVLAHEHRGHPLSLQHQLANFLLQYRSTRTTQYYWNNTGRAIPGRQIRTRFTFLKPNLRKQTRRTDPEP